jgi:hypothetical protein
MSADPLVLLGQLREKLKEQYIESARAWRQVELLKQEVARLKQPNELVMGNGVIADLYREVERLREALAAHQQVGA